MALPAVLEHPHPAWLRALGARIGAEVEASTVLLIPVLTTVNDGAFLADDTLWVGTSSAAGGCGSSRSRSASTPSWATPE